MHEAVHSVSVEAGWRLRSLLRSQRYFNTSRMVLLYKSLVLSYIESVTPAIYHAADSVLAKVDRVQERLLERLHLSQKEAFSQFNLAPLRVRRDIAMLGLLHRISIGSAPERLKKLFPSGPVRFPAAYPFCVGFHLTRVSHSKQLQTPCTAFSTERMKRSVYGLVDFYNSLPSWIVSIPTVSLFQRILQGGAFRFSQRSESWKTLFTREWRTLSCHALDNLFQRSDLTAQRERCRRNQEPDNWESDSELSVEELS